MTTQEKLLEAAEAALRGDAYLVLEKTGMKKEKGIIYLTPPSESAG